jgi:phage/plasmid-associated DNA primase
MSSNFSNPTKNIVTSALGDINNWGQNDWAKIYYKYNPDKYLWSNKTGWYSYNENNILESHKKEPYDLIESLIVFIEDLIEGEMVNLKLDNPNYQKIQNKYLATRTKCTALHFVECIQKYLMNKYHIKDLDEKIDARQDLFSFKNKVFDIKLGKYRNIEKADYICKNTGYNVPDIKKDFTLIDKLVFSIFEDQEVCDYCLMTTAMSLFTNRFEKLYIMTGNGRNGKGVLSSIVQKALGNYYCTGNNDLLTSKDAQCCPTLATAKGIRYICISEPACDATGETKFNIPMVKKLTGRDILNVRGLYKDPLTYLPEFTMFISCNRQPTVDETNEAIKNRFRFIHFPFTFVDEPTKVFERK